MNDEQLRQPSDMPVEQDNSLDDNADTNADLKNTGRGEDTAVDDIEASMSATSSMMDATDAVAAMTADDLEDKVPETSQEIEQLTGSALAEPVEAASLRSDMSPNVAADTTAAPPDIPEAIMSETLPSLAPSSEDMPTEPNLETQAMSMGDASPLAEQEQDMSAMLEGEIGVIESEGEEGEAPVVRSARDPRLTEVAANASMEDLLKASEQQYRTLKHGDVIEGTVMKVDRDEILVDIGSKSEGIIPSHELQSLTEEERETMKVGDELLVSVVQTENAEGHAILSLDRARQEKSWRDLQKSFEEGEIIEAPVSGYNKGGLLVNLSGVRGFVPSSQVSSLSGVEATKQSEMSKLQGKPLSFKIIEINRSRNRLILSERQAMQEQRESMRSRLLKELEPGQIRPGTVSSICDFGAFVDIGGADGLIHLSELSWKRVSHPREVLSVGDRINVYILSVDPNERKIALSLKRTQPEPWSTITENYHLGQIVRATITQLTSFGAFARLDDGIEGLIHVSELAEGRVAHPKNVVKEGDVVDLKVIRIDPVKKRIGLSLKRVNEDAEGAAPAAEGEVTEGAEGAATTTAVAEVPIEDADTGEKAPAAMRTEQAPTPSPERPREPRSEQRAASPERSEGEREPRAKDRSKAERAIAAPRMDEESEPMGTMAHAFAKLAQSQAATEESVIAEPEEVAEPSLPEGPEDVLIAEAPVSETVTVEEVELESGDVVAVIEDEKVDEEIIASEDAVAIIEDETITEEIVDETTGDVLAVVEEEIIEGEVLDAESGEVIAVIEEDIVEEATIGDDAGTSAGTGTRSNLHDLRGMTDKIAEKLQANSVNSIDDLLSAGSTPEGRNTLAEAVGVDKKAILNFVNKADLSRIKGVGSIYSNLLEEAGVDTVVELATRNPENLLAKLEEINTTQNLAQRLPTLDEVTDWIEQAKNLPRMINY